MINKSLNIFEQYALLKGSHAKEISFYTGIDIKTVRSVVFINGRNCGNIVAGKLRLYFNIPVEEYLEWRG